MTASIKTVRLIGIPMLLVGICSAVMMILEDNALGGYIADGLYALSAVLAGVHMLFMHGRDRAQGLMPAAFFLISAGYMMVLILWTIAGANAFEVVFSVGTSIYVLSLIGFGVYALGGISLLTKGRLKAAAVAAMSFAAATAVYSVVEGFSAMAILTALRSVLMTAYLALSPRKTGESERSGHKAVAAAVVLFVISALMHIIDTADYFITLDGSINIWLVAIYTAPVLASACFILYSCVPGIKDRCPALLPAGFLLMAMPTILDIVYGIVEDNFYIHYIMILMLVCAALCIAGCFVKRQTLWEAAAMAMAIYLLTQLGQYADYLLTTILYFVNYTYADIIPVIWYAVETLAAGIGVILLIASGGGEAVISINLKLPDYQPSTLEYDLAVLKQRFEAGELTEEEYNALRTERLELP